MQQRTEATPQQRYQVILDRIHQACISGRQPPELLAVSKTQDPIRIRELFALGQRRFGENYAQELLDKAGQLNDLDLEWVFIGHLQSNKIKKIVQVAHEIQTVASLQHAERIAKSALELGKTPFPIYLEVNAGDEDNKSGVAWDSVQELADAIQSKLPALKLEGLMAIPPSHFQDDSTPDVPKLYRDLRILASSVGEGKLSMGMSGDLRLAIQAGTDTVRIGTALFGPRAR